MLAFSTETAEPQDAKWALILVLGAFGLVVAKRINSTNTTASDFVGGY